MAPFPGEGQPEMRETPSPGEWHPAMRVASSPGEGSSAMQHDAPETREVHSPGEGHPAPQQGPPEVRQAPSPGDGQPAMQQGPPPENRQAPPHDDGQPAVQQGPPEMQQAAAPGDGQPEVSPPNMENEPPPGPDGAVLVPNGSSMEPVPQANESTGNGLDDGSRGGSPGNSGLAVDPRDGGQPINREAQRESGPGAVMDDPARQQNGGNNLPAQPIFDGSQAPFLTYTSTGPLPGATPTSPSSPTVPPPAVITAPAMPNPTGSPLFTTYPSTLSDGHGPAATGAPPVPPKGSNDANGSHGLNPTAEHLLISAGSIGAFLLVCLGCWIMWRKAAKTKRRSQAGEQGHGFPRMPDRWRNKFPLLRRQSGWVDLDHTLHITRAQPPDYKEKGSSNGGSSLGGGSNRQEKPVLSLQRVDGNVVTRVPGGPLNSQAATMGNVNNMFFIQDGMGTVGSVNTVDNTLGSSNTAMYSHQAEPSIASTYINQSGAELSGTSRSGMADHFYNQSELARNPSDAYDPGRRQVNRASELSSLSSGFGDGDMVITAAYMPGQHHSPPTANTRRRSSNAVGQFSWMSRGGNRVSELNVRDTVYTQDSEDSPARFRTVTSWVDQQAGRIKRAQQRAGDNPPPVPQVNGQVGVPGIPNAPTDQHFSLMMNDGEEPRRVEDALAAGIAVMGVNDHPAQDQVSSPMSDTASHGAPGLSLSPIP